KLYTACDIALGLLLTRCPSLTIKEYPVEVKLPRSLFAAAPASFRNPDFAQLLDTSENEPIDQISLANSDRPADAPGKPRIQFTPVKNGRALKEGLIPLQLLKDKASNPTGDRTTEKSKTEENVAESNQPIVVVTQSAQQICSSAPTQQKRPITVAKKQTKLITDTLQLLSVKEPSEHPILTDLSGANKPSTSSDTTSLSRPFNSPKKHTQIVLGTPEIESDNTNSPISQVKKRGRPPKSTQNSIGNMNSASPNGRAAKFRKLDSSPPQPKLSTKSVYKKQSSLKKKLRVSRATPSSPGTPKARTHLAVTKNCRTIPRTKLNVPKKTENSPSAAKSPARKMKTPGRPRKLTRLIPPNAKQRMLPSSSSSLSSPNSRRALRSPATKR
ncbi:hypothetical protein FBUS_10915, partial [Fasciolopsis buskii]